MLLWGKCLNELIQTELSNNPIFVQIYNIWKKYHNLDIHAGTPEQESALRNAVANNIIPSLSMDYYDQHCVYLKSIDLYDITLPDGTQYHYGHGYTTQPIPDTDLKQIYTFMTIMNA